MFQAVKRNYMNTYVIYIQCFHILTVLLYMIIQISEGFEYSIEEGLSECLWNN